MASAGATEVDERLQSHNDLYEEEDLIINGQLNLSSSLSSIPLDMKVAVDILPTISATANNDLNTSQNPSLPDFETVQVNGSIEQPAVLQSPKLNSKANRMSYQGIDLSAEAGETSSSISWHIPHPLFVIILVGPEELPFGIQKDLLISQSPYYREEFEQRNQNTVELIVKLPDTNVDTFGCFQNFIFTGEVYDKARVSIPDYSLLMGVWKLATKFKMAPLRVAVLDVMNERRQQTSCIPGTPLLVQAWKETEEGSGLRMMLITWAAEHMRASPEIRNTFAKSLPQEILSELVIVMSELPAPQAPISYLPRLSEASNHSPNAFDIDTGAIGIPSRPSNPNKRSRKSDIGFSVSDDAYEVKSSMKKVPRLSEPSSSHRRKSKGQRISVEDTIPMTADREMNFCRDLIFRMLSGPGYWTRLVGPFRNPVDPIADNVPNYFAVVKRPMDLVTIRDKMGRSEYHTAEEFEADVRLIFQNCYEYWTENDQIFNTCSSFEKYFNEKWNARHKWVAPTIKSETAD